MARCLPDLLKELEKEYLAVEGLMASFVNKGILPMFITKANDLYEKMMLKCQSLGENDILLDCNNVTKSSVIKCELDFDERVKEWLDRAERAADSSDSESESKAIERSRSRLSPHRD